MVETGRFLLDFMRQAWGVLVMAMAAAAVLAMLAQVLKTAGASILGANLWVWEALGALVSILALALFAFLGAPQIVRAAIKALPNGGSCGPMSELGQFAAMIIGGIVGLRLITAAFKSIASAAVGGPASMSTAMVEAGEAIFGILIAALIVPLVAHFLGAC